MNEVETSRTSQTVNDYNIPVPQHVALSSGDQAQFPDRCVGCGRNAPGGIQKFESSVPLSPWNVVSRALSSGRAVAVPVCPRCDAMLRNRKAISALAWILSICFAVGITTLFVEAVPLGQLSNLFVAAITAVLMWGLYKWQLQHPAPFHVVDNGGWFDYQFLDAVYAAQFAVLNDAEVYDWDEETRP